MHGPRAVTTSSASPAGGHYSQGVVHGGVVYVSGQLPITAAGERRVEASFGEQAALALENVLSVVAAAGGTPASILKVTVYVVGIEHWPAFNAVYAARMGDARPARAVVPVPALNHGFLVEIDAVAAVAAD